MVLAFVSRDGRLSAGDIGDYIASHVLDPVNRVQGVGSVQVFGSKYAMRIWLNADKLKAYGLTPADVTAAVQSQNAQVSMGKLGGAPAVRGQQLNATVTALGRLRLASARALQRCSGDTGQRRGGARCEFGRRNARSGASG